MSFFEIPGLTILASKPGGGKSTLIRFELYKGAQLKKYDYAIIFTKNADDNWEQVIDSQFIYYNFSEKALAKILKFQLEHINENLRLLLIFDDVIGSIDFNSQLMTILITRYRHFNIELVFSTQYLFKIPPTIRVLLQSDYILPRNQKINERLLRDLWSKLQNLSSFC